MMRRVSLIPQPSGAGAAVTLEGVQAVRQTGFSSDQNQRAATCLRPHRWNHLLGMGVHNPQRRLGFLG